MLYVANFSYTDQNEQEDTLCTMPALVEASDAEDALERFSELLHTLRENEPLLNGAREIYLDSLIELKSAPSKATLIQWQKVVSDSDGLYNVVCALPANEEEAHVYAWDGDSVQEASEEGLRIDLTAEDLYETFEENEEQLVDATDAESLANALAQALELLSGNDLAAFEDEDLSAAEQPFLTFDA